MVIEPRQRQMHPSEQENAVVRFGVFEFDPGRRELRKNGLRRKVQEQPFEVLQTLIEHAGEVVSRETLQRRLWPNDTVVDYDNAINTAVRKLRETLGDNAENPRFIETVARRGYRFIAPVSGIPRAEERDRSAQDVAATIARVALVEAEAPAREPQRRRRGDLAAIAAVALVAALVLYLYVSKGRPQPSPALVAHQLTENSTENPVLQSVISPDGTSVAYGDRFGIHMQLMATGEMWTIPRPGGTGPQDNWWPVAWFPDGNSLLAGLAKVSAHGIEVEAWSALAHSGGSTLIRRGCLPYSVSPDGTKVAFTAGGDQLREEVWVMSADGKNASEVVGSTDKHAMFSWVRWSPDGDRLAYRREELGDDKAVIESVAVAGSAPARMASDAYRWGDFVWPRRGTVLLSVLSGPEADMNLWAQPVDERGSPTGERRQVTEWSGFAIENISISRDGTRLAFDRVRSQTDVFIGELSGNGAAGPKRLTLDNYDDAPFAWTLDGGAVLFTSNRRGASRIMRQRLDREEAETILAEKDSIGPVRLAPDGHSLLYVAWNGESSRLMTRPLGGGLAVDLGAPGRVANVTCSGPAAATCVLGTLEPAQGVLDLWSFDAAHPEFRRLFDMQIDLRRGGVSWSLSPDGKQIAMNRNESDRAEIDVYGLDGTLERKVEMNGFNRFLSIDWDSNGRSWLVGTETPTGGALMRVYANGRYRVLANMRGQGKRTWGIASPDGTRVAYLGWTVERNAATVEHFKIAGAMRD